MENRENVLQVGIDKIREGMVLYEDLRDFNGRLLLKKQTTLGPRDLRILKMWGITEAKIEKPASESFFSPGPDIQPTLDDKTTAIVEDIFYFSDMGHDFNLELKRLLLQKISRETMLSPQDANRELKRHLRNAPDKPAQPMNLLHKLNQDIKLPSLPSIVIHINEAIQYPNCTATHIAEIINKDSSLSARLLRLVNSAFYNFPMPIESIARAVTIIGTKQVSALATATAVTSTFHDLPQELIDMKSFWKHSLATGIISRLLSSYKKNVNTESFFLAGLLHDIGRLILYQYFPQQAQTLLYQAQVDKQPLYRVEKHILEEDHTGLASHLITLWKLPLILEYASHFHHSPQDSPEPLIAAIVHTADIMTNALRYGTSGEYYVPPLSPEAWKIIGLPVSVIAPIIQQTDKILNETIHMYLSGQ